MTEQIITRPLLLEDDIAAAEAACRGALAAEFSGFAEKIPSLPKTPEACFAFLGGLPEVGCGPILAPLVEEARRVGITTAHAVERYLVLQACLVALPRLRALPLGEDVHRQFCSTCRLVASPPDGDPRLAYDSDAYAELTKLASLRRFHAGQLSFDVERINLGTLLWWSLMVHPFKFLGWLRQLVCDVGIFGRVVQPHMCYWRAKPMYIFRSEQERSLWRIAQSIERDPGIRGVVAMSWLYSADVGREFPHLAWARDIYTEQNAYHVALGLAPPDHGFLVGSEKRRRMYAEGKFHPRLTYILWRRADILAWAARWGQLDEGNETTKRIRDEAPAKAGPSRADRWAQSGRHTLVDARAFLEHNPIAYAALILFLPALLAAAIVSLVWTVSWGALAFFAAAMAIWIFQYFFLQ